MSLLPQVKGIIFLFYKSPRPSSVNPLTAHLYKPFKRYSSKGSKEHRSHGVEVRAPSMAEEFKRVAEEKLRAAEQGVARQTSEKFCDGAEEATIGESKVDSIKKRLEQHEAAGHLPQEG